MSQALLIIDMQEYFVPEIAGLHGLVERLAALRNSWRETGAPVVVVRQRVADGMDGRVIPS